MDIITPAMQELYDVIEGLTPEQRIKKASRHLDDALHLRRVRHDVDRKII